MSAPGAVAAVIPARDGVPHVLDAVESVLDQTRRPAEVIVVDDSSRDGTAAAVEARFAGDRRAPVRVLRGLFGGAAAARNAGWRAAAAPWVAFLDADDVWTPDKLQRAAETLARAPGVLWFFSDGSYRSLDGELHPSWFALYVDLPGEYVGSPLAELFEVNFVLTSAVLVRRDALEGAGGFDESLSHAEDLDLWIRLARRGLAAASPLSLVCYRHREGSLSRQRESRLLGDADLFRRLAVDADLPPGLRRAAARRRAMAHYKLAVAALRESDRVATRRHLREAWLFPERVLPVAAALAASLLPPAWLRRQAWAMRPVGRRFLSPRRVRLRSTAGEAR